MWEVQKDFMLPFSNIWRILLLCGVCKYLQSDVLTNMFCHVYMFQRRYPCTPEEREVCLMVLTGDGYMKVLNADTGFVLKSVFLSSAIDNHVGERV